ncbi:MAG TPA: serine hydrolase domain-containing protein [Candidatus Eisenbacteria bacterium]
MTLLFLLVISLATAGAACGEPPSAGASPRVGPTDLAEFSAFIDSIMTAEMAAAHIPGAAFVFIRDHRVILARGYGLADVEAHRAVAVDSTIWRVGSISKVFTATAVMQLVDRGLVELDAPIDRYVHKVSIPATFPDPVTVRQLLDHTAGFDEIRPGTQAASRDSLLPLADFLRHRLVRVRPPGRTIAYSTYGMTLAGELVEEVSGQPFERYMEENIWRPLGMSRTCINVPERWLGHTARGYELSGDSLAVQPWEWYHTIPASSINATASDMARFLLAHLDYGAAASERLFDERTGMEMQRQQVTMDPRLPGFALGFYEDYVGKLRVLEHGGNTAGFSAELLLIPGHHAGFFVVNHLEGSRLRDNLKWALLQRYYPAARERHQVPPLTTAAPSSAVRFAGQYVPTSSCWSCRPVRASSLFDVTSNPDGSLTMAGGRWIPVDSLLFVNEKGTGYIAFRANSSGAITHCFPGGFWSFQRVPE